jgi:hypothetical protein
LQDNVILLNRYFWLVPLSLKKLAQKGFIDQAQHIEPIW